MITLDETHDPKLRCWLASADAKACDFPIQNLPFGVFRRAGGDEAFRGGVAIGDSILDLGAIARSGVLSGDALRAAEAGSQSTLNQLMALGRGASKALRLQLSRALRAGSPHESVLRGALLAQAEAEMALPAQIGDYTDFYASIHHATRVGRLMRPDQPLLPNYKWIPVGYHGRSSSIAVSPMNVRRPLGQTMPQGAGAPVFGPSRRLDYELELGIFVGVGNGLGEPIPIGEAESHAFGICLLNDWSARDIQGWEYQPLGPFLAKNFATTISPWIVSLDALAPFRVPFTRPSDDPPPMRYLSSAANEQQGGIDIRMEVAIQTAAMRDRGEAAAPVSSSSFRHSYWTLAQLLTHHTVNGCNLRPGDLLGSGTQSGPLPEESGSLLELTSAGKQRIKVGSSETRAFLEDGDTVALRAWCEHPSAARIGFGAAVGTVLASRGQI